MMVRIWLSERSAILKFFRPSYRIKLSIWEISHSQARISWSILQIIPEQPNTLHSCMKPAILEIFLLMTFVILQPIPVRRQLILPLITSTTTVQTSIGKPQMAPIIILLNMVRADLRREPEPLQPQPQLLFN